MSERHELLNDSQRRHLATSLSLMAADLAELRSRGLVVKSLRSRFDAVATVLERLVGALELPPLRDPNPPRQVHMVAELWAVRTQDIRSAALRGYGAVKPELVSVLDPLIEDLRDRLQELAGASAALAAQDGTG